MIGMERNADLVTMSCYAPLLAHTEAWQWKPDLIYFDNLRVLRSANYYVQQLFSQNLGTHLLETTIENSPMINADLQGFHATTALDTGTNEIILKVVNATDQAVLSPISIRGQDVDNTTGTVRILTAESLSAENTMEDPMNIVPTESDFTESGDPFHCTFPPLSLAIIRIPPQ